MHREAGQVETVGLKQCYDCGYELLERDRYCRRCGIWQRGNIGASDIAAQPTLRFASHGRAPSASRYRSFSGPLINAVTDGIAISATTRLNSRVAKGVVCALISLPIWLLIVLLSPLDAWIATRAATDGCNSVEKSSNYKPSQGTRGENNATTIELQQNCT